MLVMPQLVFTVSFLTGYLLRIQQLQMSGVLSRVACCEIADNDRQKKLVVWNSRTPKEE